LIRQYARERQVTGGKKKLHNQELHKLYCLINTVRAIKERELKLRGTYQNWGKRNVNTVFVQGLDGKIIPNERALKENFEKVH
jgi:hypothetical protein